MSTIPDTATPHAETAQAMLIQLRQITQSIAGFTFMPPGRRRKLVYASSVPDEFLQAVAVACDASPRLASASEITGAELRDTISFAREFLSVADELELLANGLRSTVKGRRADVGQRALRAYSAAKRINAPEDHETLIPHINDMQRTLAARNRPKSKTDPKAPAKTKVTS